MLLAYRLIVGHHSAYCIRPVVQVAVVSTPCIPTMPGRIWTAGLLVMVAVTTPPFMTTVLLVF